MIRDVKKEDIVAIENIFLLHWPDPKFRERLSQRLNGALSLDPDIVQQKLKYLVAEEDGEVLGVAGFRNCPDHMIEFASTKNPAELYIIAVKNPGNGLGEVLVDKVLEKLKEAGYTEMVLYSGETHKKSWAFYERLGFEKVAEAPAPNGEPGRIWTIKF